MTKPPKPDKYDEFVEHPRFGRRPRFTGLNPSPFDPSVNLHWNSISYPEIQAKSRWWLSDGLNSGPAPKVAAAPWRIANTAIVADLTRQTRATVAVTHYFDLERKCRDCGRSFIFFAQEQKHWYEELGFGLDSQCIRCVPCRKLQQGLDRQREIFESLFHVTDKTVDQRLEMAEACLELVEAGVFSKQQTQRVRALLNAIPNDAGVKAQTQRDELLARVVAIEAGSD